MPLAQFNIARARWSLDDPRMADFMNNVWRMNALAERSEGFIWRLKDEGGPDAPDFGKDKRMTFTLSVWRDLDSLRSFTWNTIHKKFRMRGHEWFEDLGRPYLAIWPIAQSHRPNGAEALKMLARLTEEGPSENVMGSIALRPKEMTT